MPSLEKKQSKFALLMARLILYSFQQGFEVTLGEAWRSPETCEMYAKDGRGIKKSNHELRLAMDLALFKDGVYLTDSAQYLPLGEFWETLSDPINGIKCVWGGNFSKPDGNHFSFEHNGVS